MSTSTSTLRELFAFLRAGERTDVRKVAAEGLAANSMNNADLARFIAANEDDAITTLLVLLSPDQAARPCLGNALTTLINVAADTEAAAALCKNRCISRVVRLYDGLKRSAGDDAPDQMAPLLELALMLLNNLTASHVTAVLDLLQVGDDEDLQGFNLSLLHTHYAREEFAARDRRPWYLKVCLNVTRCAEGQDLLLADDDWCEALVAALCRTDGADEDDQDAEKEGAAGTSDKEAESEPVAKAQAMASSWGRAVLAVQIVHHMCGQKGNISRVVDRGFPGALLKCLCGANVADLRRFVPPSVLITGLETIEAMMSHEQGMQALEELNAKKLLQGLVQQRSEDEAGLSKEARGFIEAQLLPFLDDINDVYAMNNPDDEVD